MSQVTSQSAPNSGGSTYRSNINNILAALFSASSGASAPSTTVGGQFWLDTGVSPPVLRVRNTANTAWIVVSPETIAASSVWGNSSGSAGALAPISMATLRTMLGFPTTSGLGVWSRQFVAASTIFTLPAGGTWAYFYVRRNNSTGAVSVIDANVAAGGTNILALSAGEDVNALTWRIS
jgi:hypothetical protein